MDKSTGNKMDSHDDRMVRERLLPKEEKFGLNGAAISLNTSADSSETPEEKRAEDVKPVSTMSV